MIRLRVMSKVGRPRRRARYVFDVKPQVIEVDETEMWPANTKECRELGVWPPADPKAPIVPLIDYIRGDTDQYDEEGNILRHGGLFISETDLDETDVAKVVADNKALAAEVATLRERLAAREAASSKESTGAPERLKRTTSEDFGSTRPPAKPADKG